LNPSEGGVESRRRLSRLGHRCSRRSEFRKREPGVKENGWKIALVVVLLAAAGWLGFRNIRGSDPAAIFPDQDTYVDVSTGETFVVSRTYPVSPIRVNPRTGEETLVLIYQGEEGDWFLSSHFEYLLEQVGDKNKCIDPESLKVRTENGDN
jgi:hypothetical protein